VGTISASDATNDRGIIGVSSSFFGFGWGGGLRRCILSKYARPKKKTIIKTPSIIYYGGKIE
jgi:hypothetical protein